MAIIWADFPSGQHGLYGTDTALMLNGIWASLDGTAGSLRTVTLTNDPDPNIGSDGRVLRTFASGDVVSTVRARFALPAPSKTEGIAVRAWLPSLPQNNITCPIIAWQDGANQTMFCIRILSNGAIEARTAVNGTGTQYGVTDGPVVVANAFNHIEVKAFSDAAAGTIEVRVNGVVKLNLTGLNTNGADIAQYWVGVHLQNASTLTADCYWKDMVFWDASGDEGDDFQGSVAVHDLLPDADIDLNWTPSSGSTGFDLIDEGPPADTGYIQAGDPPPDPAVFSLTDLPEDVTSVRALLPIVRAVKTDGGDCNIQVGLTPNNSNWDDGADRPITTAFTYWWDVSHLSPATSAPWTPVEVNAAYVRLDRTS